MIRALDLIQQIARSAAWPEPSTINGTTDLKTKKLLQATNYIGLALGRYFFWRWLYQEGHIRTIASYNTGDADVTIGSKAISSDNATSPPVWTEAMVGRAFKSNAYQEVYRIESVTPTTALNLVETYNGATATDGSYVIAQDTYPLPENFDGELNFVQFLSPSSLIITNPLDMDQSRYGPGSGSLLGTTNALVTGTPTAATIRGIGTDNRLQLQLDPFPSSATQIRFGYYAMLSKLVGDEDEWPFPKYMESLLHDGALHYVRQNAQDDSRGQFDLQKFFSGRSEIAGLQRPTDVFARFQPDTGLRRRRRRRRRVSTGSHDLGDAFDRVY